ncbi:MAG: adenosylmethionine decarboxylase [Planctomycetota bacterium]|nr:adenosylmethionine decarboxylase [Planctomycetota bacterium]
MEVRMGGCVQQSTRCVKVKHLAAKLSGCDPVILNDEKRLKEILEEVSSAVKMSVLQRVSHRFEPQGVSLVYLLAESHISIHTWPECGVADLEIVTCREESDVSVGLKLCKERLKAVKVEHRVWTFAHNY